MLFVCYTPKFPENPEPNRTNRDLGRSCSVSSRSIGCSSRFGLGLGREVKNLIGIGLNPRTDTEHRAVSVHSQACLCLTGNICVVVMFVLEPRVIWEHNENVEMQTISSTCEVKVRDLMHHSLSDP